jgi:nucleotide-binding universal stress UspA family protein
MDRIVVGVDGSESSQAALVWALEEGRVRSAQVDVVTAWHEPYVAPTMAAVVPDPAVFSEAAERTLDRAVDDAGSAAEGVTIERHVVRGNAASALLEVAEGAALLVVGSRGRGGFAGLLLGSISQQVVHHASCPVVVVPQPH